jgi:protein gp37
MQKTKIEYLDYTWNPIAMKCDPVSEGCANCWHLNWVRRFGHKQPTQELVNAYAGRACFWKEFFKPPRKPSTIGVQYMGDLFHYKVSWNHWFEILKTVGNHPEHIFIILTKRPKEAKQALDDVSFQIKRQSWHEEYPFKNLWLGVSVENQRTADERIPILLQIPAKVRFVSVEPMLSDVNLVSIRQSRENPVNVLQGLDWVICGAETGRGARPMQDVWALYLEGQCKEAGVPFFFKKDSRGNPELVSRICREFPKE